MLNAVRTVHHASQLSMVSPADVVSYQRDLAERWVLFLDTLRRRANTMLAHERAGLPPVLSFEWDMVLDGREDKQPVNYALLRILTTGDACYADCVDPTKRPIIIIDPRAGHGPGIGGFKKESEVGMALHLGHPVYFIVFYPDPCPGQTLTDVLTTLRRFVLHVGDLHGEPPVLYGNCQAGWAALLAAAHCGDRSGPVVLNGSPLSYWAGEPGINPMRLAGGFVGGAWLAHFVGDLGHGKFDGAWLAQNFENLKPEAAILDKYAHLFTHVDTERERFLAFERWWNGFYDLTTEEIVAIIENLFVGNRLEEGRVHVDGTCTADLTQIQTPLVIFSSYGDNITPPHQALAWIPAVYGTTERLVAAKQRIIYLTNPEAGHLGLFVSGAVARFEHRAMLEHLPSICALAPGLYEMRISNPTGDPDCRKDQYVVAFEPRQVEDLSFAYPKPAFDFVRRVSEFNEAWYKASVSPWVKAMSNPLLALTLHWLHPMRVKTAIFSEAFMPPMACVASSAEAINGNRHALPSSHPLVQWERSTFGAFAQQATLARHIRDATFELMFQAVYGWADARQPTPAGNEQRLPAAEPDI